MTYLPARGLLAAVLVFASSLLAGCDNTSSSPTAPSTGVGVLQVVGARPIVRAAEQLTLAATAAGVAATGVSWTSSDATVASVTAAGLVTARRAGRTTLTASSAAGTGSVALRVVPDFAGTWAGALARPQLTCAATSGAALCAPGATTAGTITLTVTQAADRATATLRDSAEPTAVLALTGQVLDDDQLSLAGRVDVPAVTPALRVDVSTFRATIDPTRDTMTGSYVLTVDRAMPPAALQSDYRAQAQFRDLPRR